MKNKNKDPIKYQEIDISVLKKLKTFESVDAEFNELGYTVTYTRVPGGLIRLVINTEMISQVFIPIQNQWFILV